MNVSTWLLWGGSMLLITFGVGFVYREDRPLPTGGKIMVVTGAVFALYAIYLSFNHWDLPELTGIITLTGLMGFLYPSMVIASPNNRLINPPRWNFGMIIRFAGLAVIVIPYALTVAYGIIY